MTLNEAIKRYTQNAEYERTHGSLQGCLEFRQLAEWLKELKQLREQQPCEDAISRQAVLNMQYRIDDSATLSTRDVVNVDDIVDLPPVNPQPKTGHWIDDKCSICGKGIEDLISSREWYRNEEPNFCPFCEAKMVEPKESEVKDADSN